MRGADNEFSVGAWRRNRFMRGDQASFTGGQELGWCSFNYMVPEFLIIYLFLILRKCLLNFSILSASPTSLSSLEMFPVRREQKPPSAGEEVRKDGRSRWDELGAWAPQRPAQGGPATGQREPLFILGRALKYWKLWPTVTLVVVFSVVWSGRNSLEAYYSNSGE